MEAHINPFCQIKTAPLPYGGLVFRTGVKNSDFVVFNPFNIELKDEPPIVMQISLEKTDFWAKLRAAAWSANCKFFFAVSKKHIIIGNTDDEDGFICANLSVQIFKVFICFIGKPQMPIGNSLS